MGTPAMASNASCCRDWADSCRAALAWGCWAGRMHMPGTPVGCGRYTLDLRSFRLLCHPPCSARLLLLLPTIEPCPGNAERFAALGRRLRGRGFAEPDTP